MIESETAWNPPPTRPAEARGVTRDAVRHVAALAALELSAEEEERMERDLNAILGYVAELNELDTAAVEPLSQVSEILALGDAAAAAAPEASLRADEPHPSLPRTTVMAGAPAGDGIFFKVPKVIER